MLKYIFLRYAYKRCAYKTKNVEQRKTYKIKNNY